jgi:hypothetical protein
MVAEVIVQPRDGRVADFVERRRCGGRVATQSGVIKVISAASSAQPRRWMWGCR